MFTVCVPIPKCDECVLAEEDGLGPAGRLGELGKHDPGAETLRVNSIETQSQHTDMHRDN